MSVQVIKYGDSSKGADKGNETSILETCIRVTAQAKSLSPVDNGLLGNSIMYKTGLKSGGNTEGKELTITPRLDEGYVGSNTEYAVYQEFGTRNMDAQPYLRPAVDIVTKGASFQTAIKKIMNSEMTKAIRAGKKVTTL